MSTVAFFCAKGAPGTTTAAMLVASLWPRAALLVDADPAGGDIALRLPAPGGQPLDLGKGMLSLLPHARRVLRPETVLEHAQQVLGGGEVLAGLGGPAQAVAAGPVWPSLADAFAGLSDRDVVLDVGRLDTYSPVLPLVTHADLAVCVVQASLTGVFGARARLRTLLPALIGPNGHGPRVGLVIQSDDAREAENAASVLVGEFPDVKYLGALAADRHGARIFDGEHVSRPERTLLVRSGAEIVAAISDALPTVPAAEPDSHTPPGDTATEGPAGGSREAVPVGAVPGRAPGEHTNASVSTPRRSRFGRARRDGGAPS